MTCIISPHVKDNDGYARKMYKNKTYSHHRVVYAQHNNIDLEDMKGLVVMHTCDNPPCINPEHLRLGTQQDNSKDMVNKGRQARGITNGRAKLTEQQVLEIRASTKSGPKLAIDYGVHNTVIYDIKKRKIWKHL